MISLSGLVGIVVQPHIMGVCGAGKTEFEGRFGFTFGNFMKRFCTIAWTFIGLACIMIYLTPGNEFLTPERYAEITSNMGAQKEFADQVFGRAARDILPNIMPGLVGLLFAAMLAAIMSTCDAQMVVSSGLFTENIYKKFIKPDGSPKHYLWVGRIAGLVIVIGALLLMTQFQDIIQMLMTYVQAIPAFMGMTFWFGICWRRYNAKGVWASTLVTAFMWYLTQTHTPVAWIASMGDGALLQKNIDYLPSMFRTFLHSVAPFMMLEKLDDAGNVLNYKTSVPWQMLLYIGIGAVAGVVVSMLTKPIAKEKLDHFFTLLRTPIRPGETVATPCTLPDNPMPMDTSKLIDLPNLEIPKPSRVGMIGFLLAWVMVGVVLLLTWVLANLGA